MHLLVRVILVVTHLINLIASKVQAPTSAAAMARLVIVNINAVLVLRLILGVLQPTPALAPVLINTPVPAQVTPAATATLVMDCILSVSVLLLILGVPSITPVLAPALINTTVLAQVSQEVTAHLATANIILAVANPDTFGTQLVAHVILIVTPRINLIVFPILLHIFLVVKAQPAEENINVAAVRVTIPGTAQPIDVN